MLTSIPLSIRLATLLAIALGVAWWDWRRNHPNATKWKEYSFLVSVSLIGAIFGMVNDALTSHLSPEYFIYGKGIAPGPHFFRDVMELAFQAGLVAAFVGGACYLFANNPKTGRPSLSYPRLLSLVKWPIIAAILCAAILGFSSGWFVGAQIDPEMAKALGKNQTIWFWRVWYIHIGIYAGFATGVVYGIFSIRRARQEIITAVAPNSSASDCNASPPE